MRPSFETALTRLLRMGSWWVEKSAPGETGRALILAIKPAAIY
jgi:hypothetical protein